MDEPTGKYLGRTFGNYQLQQLIGEGGFSEVYQGEQRFLGTPAALKILNTRLTRAEFEQFRQEAQTINRLHHPGIVRLFDFGVEGDIPFMAMSYAPKGSLRARYPAGSRLPLSTVVSLVKQVAAALQYAHDQGIVHRDVKPENLLIGRTMNLSSAILGSPSCCTPPTRCAPNSWWERWPIWRRSSFARRRRRRAISTRWRWWSTSGCAGNYPSRGRRLRSRSNT